MSKFMRVLEIIPPLKHTPLEEPLTPPGALLAVRKQPHTGKTAEESVRAGAYTDDHGIFGETYSGHSR